MDNKQNSISFSVNLSKKEARDLRGAITPRKRPCGVAPKKKVAWRLRRKWFNRYTKPHLIKSHMYTANVEGKPTFELAITDVKIHKAGGRLAQISYSTKVVRKL